MCEKVYNLFRSCTLQGSFKRFCVTIMKNKGGTKFRALRRKKKRGFFGKRPHEVQNDLANATSVTDQNPSCSDVPVAKSTND